MLELPQVTLIALTGKNFSDHDYAIKKSCESINFGGVKVVYDYKCDSIDKWNYKVVYELRKYVDTDFALLIHADGYVVRPDLWRDSWLDYDYIGAPWPLPKDDFSYRTPTGDVIRVGNSVSLRSRKLLELPTKLNLEWRSYYGNTNEDGALCVHWRDILLRNGVKYAPLEEAIYFSKEHEIPENVGIDSFAFHEVD